MSFFAVPEASSLPRFHGPRKQASLSAKAAEVPAHRSISPPRSRSSSIGSTNSQKQSRMSNLLNKVKAKVADRPNAVSEDPSRKPSSGVQEVPEDLERNKYGQGGSHQDEQDIRFGSATDENAAGHTFRGTVHDNAGSGDGAGSQADAQQAVKRAEQDMGNEGSAMK